MRPSLLADTGPLYAAVDRDDELHPRAQYELSWLRREGWRIVVPFPILTEAYTLVLHRLGLEAAHQWLRDLDAGAVLLDPRPEDYRAAMATIRSYPDQPLTLFDTVLAVLSPRLRAPVWTYDHHFDVLRADVWREAGPYVSNRDG